MKLYKLAKLAMKKFETFPVSPEMKVGEYSEVFQHPCFLNASDGERKEIMLKSSLSKYENELKKPWDLYFDIKLDSLLREKHVLDLGCFTGGRSVAWFERYGLMSITGVDISQVYIDAAKQFSEIKRINADFKVARGEKLPFKKESFDAILSYDVLEHVQNLEATLSECYRVLKIGGKLIVVFPGYFHPMEHHLDFVTKLPAIHYFFGGETLVKAYHEICEERGDESRWYKRNSIRMETWEKGNTINGTTVRKFRRLVAKKKWRILQHARKPIGFLVAKRSGKMALKLLSYFCYPFVYVPIIEEIFVNRIAYILEKVE